MTGPNQTPGDRRKIAKVIVIAALVFLLVNLVGPLTNDTGQARQAEQLMEQESVIAIMRPGDSIPFLSPQEKADFEEASRLAWSQPVPNEDDFAHLPPTKPYDPKTATVPDWAKPEAWVEEIDGEGNGYSRLGFSLVDLDRTNTVAQSNCGVC